MLIDSLLNPVASVINRGIDDNDIAQDLCDALDGQSLRIVVRPLPNSVLISAVDGMVDLSTDTRQQADAEITGTVLELNRLMFIDSYVPLDETPVTVVGDINIAERFRELLLCARPDLEEQLAGWLGNSTAQRLSNFARETRDWATDIAEDLTERATDYLHEDTGKLPTSKEFNTYFDEVDEIAADIEELETRLNRLAETGSA